MNGAAMDCRPENVLRSQHQDQTGLRSPGYHLQKIHRLQNSHPHPQHSKAMNYKSLSDPFVDGSAEYFQTDRHSVDFRRTSTCRPGDEEEDPRYQARLVRIREPIELPVPKFQIDENYVGDLPTAQNSKCLENSKDLDLDTRIDLLIKSKALAGMHPIFSELDQSEDSSPDSDESFLRAKPKLQHRLIKKHKLSPPPPEEIPLVESFDDPETPLSRPPSPFLSRATYLFWFNKAIELKQQAKAQEQALLEKATKKLQDTSSVVASSQTLKSNQENKPLLKNLLNEVCKELKVIVKEEFIRDVVESTAFSTLEDWWERQSKIKEIDEPKESSVGTSHTEVLKIESLKCAVENSKTEEIKLESLRSTSPKLPYPRKKDDLNCCKMSSKRRNNSRKNTSRKQHSSSSTRKSSNKTDTAKESSNVIDMKTVGDNNKVQSEKNVQVHTAPSSVSLRSCYVNMLRNNQCHQPPYSSIEDKSNLIAKQTNKREPAYHESNPLPILCSSGDDAKVEVDVNMTIKNVFDNSLNCEDKQTLQEEPSAFGEISLTMLEKVTSEHKRQKYKSPDELKLPILNCSSDHSEKLQNIPELKSDESPPKKTMLLDKVGQESEDCQVKEIDWVDLKEQIRKEDLSDNNQCGEKTVSDDAKGTVTLRPLCNS